LKYYLQPAKQFLFIKGVNISTYNLTQYGNQAAHMTNGHIKERGEGERGRGGEGERQGSGGEEGERWEERGRER